MAGPAGPRIRSGSASVHLAFELGHLTLLDHLGTSSIGNEIEQSHTGRDDDHLFRTEVDFRAQRSR